MQLAKNRLQAHDAKSCTLPSATAFPTFVSIVSLPFSLSHTHAIFTDGGEDIKEGGDIR